MHSRHARRWFANTKRSPQKKRSLGGALERLEDRWAMDGRIVISEIMYAPLAPGLPDANVLEFIELQNVGDASMNLANYEFVNGIEYTFPAGTEVPAGGYVVVAKDPFAFEQRYPGVAVLPTGFTTGTLNNNGEEIVLNNSAGVEVFSVDYNDSWYPNTDTEGFSLVPVNAGSTTVPADSRRYWKSSMFAGGSPGQADTSLSPGSVLINEVLAHTDVAGVGDWIELKNTTNNAIDISGWYLSDSGAPNELKKFRIPNNTVLEPNGFVRFTQEQHFGIGVDPVNGFAFSELGDDAFLSQADAQGNLLGYRDRVEFQASDQEKTFGTFELSTGETDFVLLQDPSPLAENGPTITGPLIINEIYYSGVNPALGRFIEIRNVGPNAESTNPKPAEPEDRWRLRLPQGGGDPDIVFDFPPGFSIPSGGFLLLIESADVAGFRSANQVPANVPIFSVSGLAELDTSTDVRLERPGNREPNGDIPYYRLDRADYNTSAPWPEGTQGGASLARRLVPGFGNDGVNWAPGTPSPGAANVTTVTVSAPNIPVDEPDTGTVTVPMTITLSGPLDQQATVVYATETSQGDRSTPGVDYVADSGILTFQPGQTTQVIDLVVNGDTISETSEVFTVRLSSPSSNITLGDPTGDVTISNNDPDPTLTVADVIKSEGGDQFVVVTFQLSQASEKNVRVVYSTADGTATSASDYGANSGTVTFVQGEDTATVTIALEGDTNPEPDEDFFINLSDPNNLDMPDTPVKITIDDDDTLTPPWQNNNVNTSRWDVDNNGSVQPLDVLILINRINLPGFDPVLPAPSPGNSPPPYYDVDGNGELQPLDVLNVINRINSQPQGSGLTALALREEESLLTEDVAPVKPADASPASHSIRIVAADLADADAPWTAAYESDDLPARVADEVEAALDELLV